MLDVSVKTKLTSNIEHLISNFMSEPEIARRCPACSVMVRMSATFCPHCGTPLQRRHVTTTTPAERNSESTEHTSANHNEEPPVVSFVAPQKNAEAAPPVSPAAAPETHAPPPVDSFATKKPDNYDVSDNRGRRSIDRREDLASGNRRRVIAAKAGAARGQLEETLRPRVAKLKQTSSTVLDEAAIDPGLRFVLVAAALFLLTVVLFLFSKLLH